VLKTKSDLSAHSLMVGVIMCYSLQSTAKGV